MRAWFTAVMVYDSTGPHTPDVDLTRENLSDIPKTTKEAGMDKRRRITQEDLCHEKSAIFHPLPRTQL